MADPGGDNAGGQTTPAPPLVPPPEAVGDVIPPPESDAAINEGTIPSASASASAPPPKSDMAVGNAVPSPHPPPPKSDMAVSDATHQQPPSPPPQKPDKAVSDTTPDPPPPQKPDTTVSDTMPSPPPPPKPEMVVADAIPPPPSPKSNTTAGEKTAAPPVPPETKMAGQPQPHQPSVQAEGSKRRRHEEADQASLSMPAASGPVMKPPETKRRKSLSRTESSSPPVAVGEADTTNVVPGSAMKTKLQNKCWLVKNTMSWYGRHRSRPANAGKQEDQGAAQTDKVQGTKPSPSPSPGEEKETAETNSKKQDEIEEEIKKQPSTTQQVQEEEKEAAEKKKKKPHPKWGKEETRLEEILEAACIRLVEAEYSRRLSREKTKQQQQCLLSFSVFPLGSKVKKQAVTYWWSTQFDLPLKKSPSASASASASADQIFEDLSKEGFLEPIKNHCSKVIHGCRVNPLVHWMVKHLARDKYLADLDEHGNPAVYQGKSQVHCFTADNRVLLQRLREEDDSKAQPKRNQTKEPPKGTKAVEGPSQVQRKPSKIEEPPKGTEVVGGPSQVQRKTSKTKEVHQDAEASEGSSKAHLKPSPTKELPQDAVAGRSSQDSQKTTKREGEAADAKVLLGEFEKKLVILNINAHVYRLPEPLLQSKLADRLQVLQLGQWWNTDNETYMEVEALETLSAIGNLKKLRYLGLRGLSKLTRLPSGVKQLQQLAILDARGCQNLVKVPSSTVKPLKALTLLDLSECYMLEHIGNGVTALTELRVFKGFVFGVGKRQSDACRLQHLAKLKKLRKLSLNVTTDADVEKDEMAQLGKLTSVTSLTVTWGEWPIFLLGAGPEDQRVKQLLDKWTGLVLPPGLEKLDARCYPTGGEMPVTKWLKGKDAPMKLKKLYVRGGDVERLDIPARNSIETLRLRFLNKFRMKWNDLLPGLKRNSIKSVEVVDKDQKVTKNLNKGNVHDDEQQKKKEGTDPDGEQKKKKEECIDPLRKRMKIPRCTIDENGVWVRDLKEEELEKDASKSDAAASTAGQTGEGKDDAGKAQTDVKEGRAHEIVKEEKDNKKKDKEEQNHPEVQELKEDEKKRASTTAVVDQAVGPGSRADVKKSSVLTCCSMFHTSLKRLKLSGGQALRKAPREDASTKAEAATAAAAAGIPKFPDNKTGERDNDAGKVQKEAKEGMDNKKKANEEEHGALVRDEKDQNKEASTTAAVSPAVPPTSDGDGKKAAVLNKVYTDKRSEPSKPSEAPDMAPKEDARKAQSSNDHANTEQEDETDTDEDRGNGLNADEPQRETDNGKDEGQVGGRKVFDTVAKQPTAGEDRGGGDVRAGDATIPPELEEKTPAKLTPAADKAPASHTSTPPVPPATTSAAPTPSAAGQATTEPKEPGPAGVGGAYTSGSTTS
ncbi:uncharacterized protein LOC104584275 isoform X2 [Brachypodium distachyon]|uniref:uncharacterized protein LOC104584275 isoform X2 n=1 Tax=Brachypodium distachyon TaxID=15368 RepID=UPI000D0DEB69|nr:uncharacterized protein LOC104584275 isoform X2 [Brachypodium distachyon]|eukprot:XP_024316225.1 uncharacterized protein LOC104584275 isoform X2 [Brachypodium distachyon]